MIVSRSKTRRPTIRFVYILIVERLADGSLGVKHGVVAFVIQFLEWYNNAATGCHLVDRVYQIAFFSLYNNKVGWERSLRMMSIWILCQLIVLFQNNRCFGVVFVQALQTLLVQLVVQKDDFEPTSG